MARPRQAGRALDAGDQARGRGRAGRDVRAGRLRARPPRRRPLERRGDREPGRHRRGRQQLRPAVARAGHARRTGRRAARRGPDDLGGLRRRPRGEPLRAERTLARLALLSGQARVVRAARPLARRITEPGRAPGARRRLQHRARRRRRVGPRGLPRRDPRLGARAAGLRQAPRLGARRHLSPPAARARPLHLVGLSRRQLPQELRHADRPPARHASRSPGGRWPSRSTAKPGRASPCPRITRPCSSISTSPGTSSIRAGSRRSSRHHSSASAIRRLCQRGSPR